MPRRGLDYLSVQEAAEYIGVSPQTLRRWDSEGKLRPVRDPASQYRFYRRADLEPFRLDFQRAEQMEAGRIFSTPANIEENMRLREPQRDAHRKVRTHFAGGGGPAILQIPVGCGKTGVIATLPFGISKRRVLVIAPNLTIRKGISDALDVANPKCFWTKTRVLDRVSAGPFCAVLDGVDANIHDCTESDFVVTNIQQLASAADRWLPQFPPSFFDLILVDEGHHNVAASWRKVFDRFPEAKVVSLTATPFRSDGRELTGDVVYRYSYARAMMNGYIKQIHSANFAPSEIYFTYRGDRRHHSLEEVLELREESWFRHGVALSPECNKHIADASISRCLSLRNRTGVKHQIIAAACSIDHARQVRAIYEECGMEAREIYSEMDPGEQDKVLAELAQGRIDCIVQVQMLGEGFDHPPLSVAAIFRPFRSLSPYIQFIGRIMRVLHENDPAHPDNQGFVISHVGLNNDANWEDFRDIDFDDQEVVRKWLGVADETSLDGEGRGAPRRFDIGMLVNSEIISHFVNQPFLNPDDDRVLDEILAQRVAGTPFRVGDLKSKEELRSMLRERLRDVQTAPQSIPVSPQRRRRAARVRLRERTNAVVARVLKDLGASLVGRNISRKIGMGNLDNRSAVERLLNQAINEFIGVGTGKRAEITAEQALTAFGELDRLGDRVRDSIKGRSD